MPSIVAIIVARLDSSRLPGKLLRSVNGKPLIAYVIERVRRIPQIDSVIMATSDRPVDDALATFSLNASIDVFRGSIYDVAHRVLTCATVSGADYFLRVNGDSPFLDHTLVTQGIELCNAGDADIVTNLINRTFPYGISVEIVKTKALADAYKRMQTPDDREHITKYFYNHLADYRVCSITSPYPELKTARMVVDTEHDLALFTSMATVLGERVVDVNYDEAARLYFSLTGISST